MLEPIKTASFGTSFVQSSQYLFTTFFNKVSDIWHFCESGVPGPSFHYHVGVRVESEKPKRAYEFLWLAELPGTLFALGADGFLTSPGELNHRGSFRYRSLSELLGALVKC